MMLNKKRRSKNKIMRFKNKYCDTRDNNLIDFYHRKMYIFELFINT